MVCPRASRWPAPRPGRSSPRGIASVENGAVTVPAASTAIRPPAPPHAATSSSTDCAASRSPTPCATSAPSSRAAPARTNASPWPVHDTATRRSAQVPAPITGESPTRPGRWPWRPPVEVAAASSPSASRHTAPTVSPSPVSRSARRRRWRSVTNSEGSRCASPHAAANASARSPASSTSGSSSRAAAAATGWRVRRTSATPPAARSLPRIMEALSSTDPSSHSTAPYPAFSSAQSSIAITAAPTASTAPPPRSSARAPSARAAARASRYSAARSRSSGPNPPAPPCTTITGSVTVPERGRPARRTAHRASPEDRT